MPSCDVKIYTRQDTPRLDYIANLILRDIMGLQYEIVSDKRKLGRYPVINYSNDEIKNTLWVYPDSLLFEKGVLRREFILGEWKNLPVFFLAPDKRDIPFDIFAASFFMVTRYEEYIDFEPDEHGRFSASLSLAHKNGFNEIPVVDLWVKEFAKVLLRKFPFMTFRRNQYKALLTIDIDVPFAYLGRNMFRQAGLIIRDIAGKRDILKERYHVLTKDTEDPYDTFDYMIGKSESSQTDTMFFFSVGSHSRFDKNPSWRNASYRKLTGKIMEKYRTGLHPSYYAAEKYSLLEKEHKNLARLIPGKFSGSRFHYLRLFFPDSYRNLLKAGIREDFSMGWHDEPGFRAGIARPYLFYDIMDERQTDLTIVPFYFMDVTLYQYKKYDALTAKDVVFNLIDRTKEAGGLFVSLWHNTTLTEKPEWKSRRELFESMLLYQQP